MKKMLSINKTCFFSVFFIGLVLISCDKEKMRCDVELSFLSYPPEVTNSVDASFEFVASKQNTTFFCKIDSEEWNLCTSPKTYQGLSEGEHTFGLMATSPEGCTSTPLFWRWLIDITPPAVRFLSYPSNVSSSYAEFTFECIDESCTRFECQFDSNSWAVCSSPYILTDVPDGEHTVKVRGYDLAGNCTPNGKEAVDHWFVIKELLWAYGEGFLVYSSPLSSDLTGDGKLEVVFSALSSFYILNGEHGTPWPITNYEDIIGGPSPAIGDINNDGKPEIIATTDETPNVYSLKGEDASIIWSYPINSPTWSSPSLGDIDGDGKLEVAVLSFKDNGCALTVLNGEDGSLLWVRNIATRCGTSSPSLGDINNDGKLEVIVSVYDTISALNGEDGSVLWEFHTNGIATSSPSLADVDGDNKIEVIVDSYDEKLRVFNGEDGSLLWDYSHPVDGREHNYCLFISIGDIDGDGKLEIFCRNYVLNGEDGSLLWEAPIDIRPENSAVIGDVNNDGKIEVVVSSGEWLYILKGQDGSVLKKWKIKTYDIISPPLLSDINGDGKLEIIVGGEGVYAIKTNSPVPPPHLLPWPMARHDVKNTGLYTGNPYPPW